MSVVYRAEAVIEWHVPEKSTHVFVHTHGRVDPECGETVGTIKVRVESDNDVADDLLRLTVERLRGALDAFLARQPARGDDVSADERELRIRGCAGEIRHGLEMLRHWQGRQPATSAWIAHVERYSERLCELAVAGRVGQGETQP